jgi:hypothetical protein
MQETGFEPGIMLYGGIVLPLTLLLLYIITCSLDLFKKSI